MDFPNRLVTVAAAYGKNGELRSISMTALLTETLKAIRIHVSPIAAEILDFTCHDLWHTFVSRLVMAGVLTTVKELRGHKRITITLSYAHLAPGHKRAAIAVLDRIGEKVPTNFPIVGPGTVRPFLQVLER